MAAAGFLSRYKTFPSFLTTDKMCWFHILMIHRKGALLFRFCFFVFFKEGKKCKTQCFYRSSTKEKPSAVSVSPLNYFLSTITTLLYLILLCILFSYCHSTVCFVFLFCFLKLLILINEVKKKPISSSDTQWPMYCLCWVLLNIHSFVKEIN